MLISLKNIITVFAFGLFFLLVPTLQAQQTPLQQSSDQNQSIPESQNQVVQLTDKGLVPEKLAMKLEDSIVFFLNSTTDSLLTLEVNYQGKKTHCATTNLRVVQNQLVRSVRPVGPRDFASVCFHERGVYPVTVFGLASAPTGIHSTITVE